MPHKNLEARKASKSASRGKPGSPERAVYNERRRMRRKAGVLVTLIAMRKAEAQRFPRGLFDREAA